MFDKAKQWLKLRWQETNLSVDDLRLPKPEPQDVLRQFYDVHATSDRNPAEVQEFIQEMCDAFDK